MDQFEYKVCFDPMSIPGADCSQWSQWYCHWYWPLSAGGGLHQPHPSTMQSTVISLASSYVQSARPLCRPNGEMHFDRWCMRLMFLNSLVISLER